VVKDIDDGKPSRLKIITTLGYLVAMLLMTFLITAIQGNTAEINDVRTDNEQQIARLSYDLGALEDKLETEVDILLESNRNRRNSIALIESNIATLRAQVDLLLAGASLP
jgi:hypothetical protein